MKIGVKQLGIWFREKRVGTVALDRNGLGLFQYDDSWLAQGFSISPISLPLEHRVYAPYGYQPFDGLFGVFSDSLPDGWGRLLVDRMIRRQGIDPYSLNSLDRLAIVGCSGMGALEYKPENVLPGLNVTEDLDSLARECALIFEGKESEDLDEIFQLGGSSGGARPKVLLQRDGKSWIVKFPSSLDHADIGNEEYDYSIAARECGLDVPAARLLDSDFCSGYFATERFDRIGGRKIHMVSAGGLLEVSHRVPCLDYNSLMSLTGYITQDVRAVEEMFRRMCFNVFAHNRDDHARNFAFLYDSEKSCWKLSPAYDMTYSHSVGGEHATTVNGNGRNPGEEDIMAVGRKAKLNPDWCFETMKDIRNKVGEMLGKYLGK